MNSTSNNLYEANHQWRDRPADERYETLAGLSDAVRSRRDRTRTVTLPGSLLSVGEWNDGLGIKLGKDEESRTMTNWAFGQLAARYHAPASYLRSLPLDLAAECLNHSLHSDAEKEESVKLMSIHGDNGNSLNAVTSTKYGRIWDADCVDAVSRIVEMSGGKFFNPKDWTGKPSGLYASDRDCFMFMIDGGSIVSGGGPRNEMNRGFICWNSETGSRTFGLMTFLFRQVCGNHIIWGADDVTKLIVRHTSGGPARMEQEAYPILMNHVNASTGKMEEQIKAAQNLRVSTLAICDKEPLDDCWIANFSTDRNFTRSEVRDAIRVARTEEGQCDSLWDLVNGFTASARSIEFMDARINLEKRAGNLLTLVE